MSDRSLGPSAWLQVPAVGGASATTKPDQHLLLRTGGGHWDKTYNRGSLMLRAETSTVGDSQEVSSIHSGQSRLTMVGDRLVDSKCKCGAKEQLILCKSRLEHLVGDDRKRRRCAVNRGKLAAAGQAALRILSDDLLAAVTEAEADMKACAARIIQEELVAGQLRESEIGIVERGCALGALRDKVASLRAIEKASQEKLRRHVDRREAERASVLEQLHSCQAVCNELRATLTAIKSRLSLMRHRVRSRQDSLEVARSDMEVYRKVLDEVPAIMVDLANGERETLQKREELERRAMALSEEMKEIDTQIASVTNSRAQEVGGRKRCLEREGKELDQLAQRLDAMQEYVGDCQQQRMSGSSRLGKEVIATKSPDELAQIERECDTNTRRLQINEEELETLTRRVEKLKGELMIRLGSKDRTTGGWRRTVRR